MKFILGITTFQRLSYLKQLISTWEQTKSDNEWKLIIADDGSDSKVMEFFQDISKKDKDYELTIIKCKDVGVHNLTNAIFKEIDGTGFDMCFKIDNDIYFKKPGWDLKYYNSAMKSGFHHLLYNRNPHDEKELTITVNKKSIRMKGIPMMYGCFYTVTQKILDEIGYFDIKNFDKAVYGHWDYSIRCCNAGFNKIEEQYDIGGSKSYVEMQGKDGKKYICSPKFKNKCKRYGLTNTELNRRINIILNRVKNCKKYISEYKK